MISFKFQTYIMEDMLKVVKLSVNATIPSRGSPGAAGYDLYSAEDVILKAFGKF